MDKIAKEFLDYLIYIGLVTNESIKSFITNLKNRVNSSDKLREILRNTLFSYLNNLSTEHKKSISSIIVNTFFDNKIKANEHFLRNLIKIYEKQLKLKYQEYLERWYTKTFSYDLNKIIKFTSRNDDNFLDNFNDFDKKIKSKRGFSQRNNISKLKENYSYSNHNKNHSINISNLIINDFLLKKENNNRMKSTKKEKLIKSNEDEYEYVFSPKNEGHTIDENYYRFNTNNFQIINNGNVKKNFINDKKKEDYPRHFKNESIVTFTGKSDISTKKTSKDKNINRLYNDNISKTNINNRKKLINKIKNNKNVYLKHFSSKTNNYFKK